LDKADSGIIIKLNYIIYCNDRFVAVGDSGIILTAFDAITWTKQNSGTKKSLRGLVYADSQFVAVGDSGVILTSKADGTGIVFQPKPQLYENSRIKVRCANSSFSVILPNATEVSKYRVGLFSVAGERVYSATSVASNGILYIPALRVPAGMYYVSIENNGKNKMSSPIILTR
jgi:hypothetical protein